MSKAPIPVSWELDWLGDGRVVRILVFPPQTRSESSSPLTKGAPVDVAPLKDDSVLAKDPHKNNNFNFSDDATQTRCPFAAHVGFVC
jgi:hypothetical protein